MKIEIDSTKLLTTMLGAALVGAFVWMWQINERVAKIESPESMMSRVETLEKLIFPIGVEYEVRKRMSDATGGDDSAPIGVLPPTMNESVAPILEATPNQPVDPQLRDAAEDDIRSMIEQRPLDEVKKRRGKPIEFKKTKD